MSNSIAMEANRRLATALGWTNIVDVGNALLGKPTWVCDNSRSQVQIPNWAGDWRDCGPLIGKYGIAIISGDGETAAWSCGLDIVEVLHSRHRDPDAALMFAVVEAVCAKLEAGQ